MEGNTFGSTEISQDKKKEQPRQTCLPVLTQCIDELTSCSGELLCDVNQQDQVAKEDHSLIYGGLDQILVDDFFQCIPVGRMPLLMY